MHHTHPPISQQKKQQQEEKDWTAIKEDMKIRICVVVASPPLGSNCRYIKYKWTTCRLVTHPLYEMRRKEKPCYESNACPRARARRECCPRSHISPPAVKSSSGPRERQIREARPLLGRELPLRPLLMVGRPCCVDGGGESAACCSVPSQRFFLDWRVRRRHSAQAMSLNRR